MRHVKERLLYKLIDCDRLKKKKFSVRKLLYKNLTRLSVSNSCMNKKTNNLLPGQNVHS